MSTYSAFEQDQYQQQTQFNRSAIKISKRWNKGYLNFVHEFQRASLKTKFCIVFAFGVVAFLLVSSLVAYESSEVPAITVETPKPLRASDLLRKGQPGVQGALRENVNNNKIGVEQPPETKKPPSPEEQMALQKEAEKKRNVKRRQAVRNAFIHAFKGYEDHAFGYDELRPVTNETNSSWGGFGVTLFDSLDTMIIMGLEEQYKKSRDWALAANFEKDWDASFFEFTIRYVGGLLSAFELTQDRDLLLKAKEMADRLLPAFNTPTGLPFSKVNLKTGVAANAKWTSGASVLAEFGSFQLEFKYLSHHLKDPTYSEKVDKVMEFLYSLETNQGLYPTYIDPKTGKFTNDLVSYGGLGDSFYEYLLKLYVLTGKKDEKTKQLYLTAVDGMIHNMLDYSVPSGLPFIGEYKINTKRIINEMDHLVCFVPGMLALGAEGDYASSHMKLAEGLVTTCYKTYETQETGIGPERIAFSSKDAPMKDDRDFKPISARYLLRPETIESLFVLYRKTHNETYREWAWNIFESIETFCKTPSSYSGLMDVTKQEGEWNNSMQSFFFAETLKYLYLIFSEDSTIPLDKYVFTTEAHPLAIFTE